MCLWSIVGHQRTPTYRRHVPDTCRQCQDCHVIEWRITTCKLWVGDYFFDIDSLLVVILQVEVILHDGDTKPHLRHVIYARG